MHWGRAAAPIDEGRLVDLDAQARSIAEHDAAVGELLVDVEPGRPAEVLHLECHVVRTAVAAAASGLAL